MPQFFFGAEFLFTIQLLAALIGAYFVAFWLGLVFWAYKDIRARSRDALAHVLAVSLVVVFNVPGLLLYMLLRPQETLALRYERSLEEEAILQELGQHKTGCPTCRRTVQEEFLICPFCRTALKRPCPSCGRPLNMAWRACPYCMSPAVQEEPARETAETIA